MFQGKGTFLKANDSYLDSSSSYDDCLSPDSSEVANASIRSSLRSKADAYEGYMTFFSNPYFFTDLSGDKTHFVVKTSGNRGVQSVLGVTDEKNLPVDDTIRDANACYFLTPRPLDRTEWPCDYPQVRMSITQIDAAGEDETQPIELDASGIGGVRPEDNFALDVQIARKRRTMNPGKVKRKIGVKPPAIYSYEVADCTTLNLQPSRLPPPSYVFFSTSSSSGAEQGFRYDDDDSEESSEAEDAPAHVGLLWQWSSSSNERQARDDGISVSSSSQGVQKTARAKAPQPGSVHEACRPTSGSLAATAGASWSAPSNAYDPDEGRDLEEDSIDSMSVGQEL